MFWWMIGFLGRQHRIGRFGLEGVGTPPQGYLSSENAAGEYLSQMDLEQQKIQVQVQIHGPDPGPGPRRNRKLKRQIYQNSTNHEEY